MAAQRGAAAECKHSRLRCGTRVSQSAPSAVGPRGPPGPAVAPPSSHVQGCLFALCSSLPTEVHINPIFSFPARLPWAPYAPHPSSPRPASHSSPHPGNPRARPRAPFLGDPTPPPPPTPPLKVKHLYRVGPGIAFPFSRRAVGLGEHAGQIGFATCRPRARQPAPPRPAPPARPVEPARAARAV